MGDVPDDGGNCTPCLMVKMYNPPRTVAVPFDTVVALHRVVGVVSKDVAHGRATAQIMPASVKAKRRPAMRAQSAFCGDKKDANRESLITFVVEHDRYAPDLRRGDKLVCDAEIGWKGDGRYLVAFDGTFVQGDAKVRTKTGALRKSIVVDCMCFDPLTAASAGYEPHRVLSTHRPSIVGPVLVRSPR
jgi:hypothetical protein